jgi:hypothetical protein
MLSAIEDLSLEHLWIIYPGDKSYPLTPNITAIPLIETGRIILNTASGIQSEAQR